MERVSVQRESWRRTPWKTGAKQRKKQRGGKRVGAAGTSRKAAVGHFDSGRRFPSCEDDSARSHQAEPIGGRNGGQPSGCRRSEEHTSELQSLMRISYAVFCLKKKNRENITT